jgi:hypothetical protein
MYNKQTNGLLWQFISLVYCSYMFRYLHINIREPAELQKNVHPGFMVYAEKAVYSVLTVNKTLKC